MLKTVMNENVECSPSSSLMIMFHTVGVTVDSMLCKDPCAAYRGHCTQTRGHSTQTQYTLLIVFVTRYQLPTTEFCPRIRFLPPVLFVFLKILE